MHWSKRKRKKEGREKITKVRLRKNNNVKLLFQESSSVSVLCRKLIYYTCTIRHRTVVVVFVFVFSRVLAFQRSAEEEEEKKVRYQQKTGKKEEGEAPLI